MEKKPKKTKKAGQAKKRSTKTIATQGSSIIFEISGRVINRETKLGAANLQIEAWHKGGALKTDNKLIGPLIPQKTSARGDFHITATDSHFEKFSIPQRPDVFFKVYDQNGKLIKSTEDAVLRKVEPGRKDIVIEVEIATNGGGNGGGNGGAGEEFIVRGEVRQADFSLAAGFLVRAFDKDLRHEEPLGQAVTGDDGKYEIRYTAAQFRRSEKDAADLVVRVYDSRQDEAESVAASPIIFNAQPIETVNLTLGDKEFRGPSEYEQLVAELTPLLDGVAIRDLTEDEEHQDVTFLSNESGQDPDRIVYLILAHRLQNRTGLPAEVFYAFFRHNLPTDLPSLLAQSREAQREALEVALRDNIIPERFAASLPPLPAQSQFVNDSVPESAGEEISAAPAGLNITGSGSFTAVDRTLAHLSNLAVRQAFVSPGDNRTSFGALLNTSLTALDKQTEFLSTFVNFRDSTEDFWIAMREKPDFKPFVNDLQFTLQLGTLTMNHLPLVNEIKRMQRQRQIGALSDLAKFDAGDWKAVIGRQGIGVPPDVPGKTDAERANNYALTLTRMMEDAFPTTAIAARIGKSNIAGKADLTTFFSRNPSFDLGRTHIETYISTNPGALDQITDKTALTGQLRGLQRINRMTPYFTEMKALYDDGLTSARAVTGMSQETFALKYSDQLGGPARAAAVYENALQIKASALNMLATYAPWFNDFDLPVLPPKPKQIEGAPNLETLFGSLDLCACAHCRSVFSPAAYLVDILHFLKDRPSKLAGKSAKDILFMRRGDIGEIELTCENTNTPLPYVDLVNEILESSVSPATAIPARQRQTGGSAQELAANPQHLNPGAYDTLGAQVFPLTLPFNLWAEEARAYLAHLGVSRHELMKKFQRMNGTNDPSDLAIASEQIAMTTFERQIITGSGLTPARQAWEFWGLQENGNQVVNPADPTGTLTLGWLQVLQRVRLFLDRSGLSYQELEELLRLKFINPGGALRIAAIEGADANTCDTALLEIRGLDEAAAGRIHRFLRLWRKLGWTMRELDKAITSLKPADINDDLVQTPADIKRLSGELKVPLLIAFSWYGPPDKARYDDRDELKPKSLYEERFQNPAVIKLNPGETDPFALNAARDELATTGELVIADTDTDAVKDRKKRILAALLGVLGVSDADLTLLVKGPRAVVTQGKELNLENLSRLFRAATFARALKLSVEEFLLIGDLAGINPFVNNSVTVTPADTGRTLRFIEVARKIRAFGFTVSQLDYLLRHEFNPAAGIAPAEEAVALALDEIRAGLQKVHEETEMVADPLGDVTGKKLALLKWDKDLIVEAVNTLGGRVVYEAGLAALPAGLVFPAAVEDRASYDRSARKLRFRGPMTVAQRTPMLGASADAAYQTAANQLFDEPRAFVSEKLKAFTLPPFAAPLAALPAGLAFPTEMKGKVFFDNSAKQLKFIGIMTEDEKTRLLALSADAAYQVAVNALFDAPAAFAPDARNRFLTGVDIAALFDAGADVAARFDLVLGKLLAYLRRTLSENLVVQKLSEALQLDAAATELLLTQWVNSPADPTRKSMAEFLADAFVESDASVKLTATGFPAQFKTFMLLSKIASVIARFKITTKQIPWVFFDVATGAGYAASAGWLDLATLPFDDASPDAPFEKWERLIDLFLLRDTSPLNEAALDDLFRLSRAAGVTQADLHKRLNEHTRWTVENLDFLAGAQGLDLTLPDAYRNERALARLQKCSALVKRLGVSAEQLRAWTKPDLNDADARSIRQAVKAKYENDQWLTLARPLRDALREKQRAALVAYLVVNPDAAQGQRWRDVNEIYEYFLIDVEMSPCQLTSRIKQANSSIQLFVQRCLMNLERNVAANVQVDKKWIEWKWMKSYRVWEANRKLFLYPENWIEPELRDDKSPFFKELENDLLQNEVTLETAEAAFLSYLEKLDMVARLEIVGTYHQVETDSRGQKVIDHLHVIGRTRGTPQQYFYRRRVDGSYWTAWEKVDVDIEGDHIIPVIWNRRLHLFWAIFTEKTDPQPVVVPAAGKALDEPVRYWEIKLGWSEYKNKKWSAKKLSQETLRSWLSNSTLEDKSLHAFKAQVEQSTNDLIIVCVQNSVGTGVIGSFRVIGCDRRIIATDLRNPKLGASHWLLTPRRTRIENTMFAERQGSDGDALYLTEGRFTPNADYFELQEGKADVLTLGRTPGLGGFQLVYAHQDAQFTAQRPFFFQDDARAFFVSPERTLLPFWWQFDQVTPDYVYRIPLYYYEVVKPFPVDPIGPVVNPASPLANPGNPPIFALSFPPSLPVSRAAGFVRQTFAMSPIGARNAEGGLRALADVGPMGAGAAEAVLMTVNNRGLANGSSSLIFTTSAAGALLTDSRAAVSVALLPKPFTLTRYRFQTFYHPYVCLFVRELNRDGVDGLLQRRIQIAPGSFFNPPHDFNFKTIYDPQPVVDTNYPKEEVDFASDSAYAQYNWELFFHAPMLIATRLMENQRFEDAQRWFHYIFDPTDTSAEDAPQKYWRMGHFFNTTKPQYQAEQIQKLLERLASGASDPQLEDQVRRWRANPFNPHLIARLRTTAYQRNVVMKYLDNLIAWGDQLFHRDTLESLNEATQLYILAAQMLGRRPEAVPPRNSPPVHTYNSLEPLLRPDDFSDPLVAVEQLVPAPKLDIGAIEGKQPPITLPTMLYFCVPQNDKLLGYWDTVADRLFKLRHCMNIEGVVRQLPLFEPPIDPALLVRAAAAGIDISSALNDINAALPHYRFTTMAQKASELCADLKSLGAALLAALEKRDAEALSLLRSTHEIKVLNAVRLAREKQIEEAKNTLEGLQKYQDVITARQQYYSTRQFTNLFETGHLLISGSSLIPMLAHMGADIAAGVLHLIPNAKVGVPTTIGITYGGANVASALQAFGASMGTLAGMLNTSASLSATMGSYQRRREEWDHQADLATKELEQVKKQIAAAEIRQAIAERELENHDLQTENAKEAHEFMRDKFTNRQLYDWMVAQIAGVYFRSYQLVYDTSKRVEQAYRFELGLQDSNFIKFGYWDSLKKGLLAGERLYHDLKRLEMAYLDQNKREYELTKHISLATLDPVALVMLKETGECYLDLPEAIFDLDYAGHYLRRIKSAGLTIPCITGPYTGVNCTLTLLSSSIRRTVGAAGGYARTGPDDTRFTDNFGAVQSIAVSSAQNDSGTFELSFRDERYLPFEGAGAISRWRIQLAKEFRQFDYNTISDVVLHVRYTAREGGDALRTAATNELQTAVNEMTLAEGRKGIFRLFSLKREFPVEWHRFLRPPDPTAGQGIIHRLLIDLGQKRFPFLFREKKITVRLVKLFFNLKPGFDYDDDTPLTFHFNKVGQNPSDATDFELATSPIAGLPFAQPLLAVGDVPQQLTLEIQESELPEAGASDTTWWQTVSIEGVDHTRLRNEAIEEIWVICEYSVSNP